MIYIIIVIGIFVGELLLKNYIEAHKEEGVDEKALGGAVLVTKYHNRGAFLETGKNCKRLVKLVSVLLTLGIAVIFIATFGQKGNHLLKVGLSLLLGGAFSNTYDRVKRTYVVDYFRINVKCKALRRIIFNISDFCIIIGVLIVAIKA